MHQWLVARRRISATARRLETRKAGKIELDGTSARVSWHKSLPLPVFICRCGRDGYRLSNVGDVWVCRKCHKLDYACRHRNRTIPVSS